MSVIRELLSGPTKTDAPQPTPALGTPSAGGTPSTELAVIEALTIDELAAATRVPSRTIRFYQAKGLLPPPRLQGRVAQYGVQHRERLALIAQLQDRGLKIDAIRELVKRIDRGEVDVSDWLGLEAELKTPWVSDQPRTVTDAELHELIGPPRAGLVSNLVRLGVIERRGEVYLIPSPSVLSVAVRLESAGVDLDTTVNAEKILRRHMSKAVGELVNYFYAEIERGHIEPQADGPNLMEMLRPTGLEAVRTVFGQEIEKVLRERVASGKATPKRALPKKRV